MEEKTELTKKLHEFAKENNLSYVIASTKPRDLTEEEKESINKGEANQIVELATYMAVLDEREGKEEVSNLTRYNSLMRIALDIAVFARNTVDGIIRTNKIVSVPEDTINKLLGKN